MGLAFVYRSKKSSLLFFGLSALLYEDIYLDAECFWLGLCAGFLFVVSSISSKSNSSMGREVKKKIR